MSGKTAIEWATQVWNPTTGCSRVSAGCDNCYAFRLHDIRFARNRALARAADYPNAAAARVAGVRLSFAAQYDLPFSRVQVFSGRLNDPRGWPKSQRVFVDSMADLFHDSVPDTFVDEVFDVMEDVTRHIYQVLTKRPERMAQYTRRRYGAGRAPAHIWLGTSVEDERVLERVDALRRVRARVRFLSCEPLLGPLTRLSLYGIHWVIAGGESGPRRRPVEAVWLRELRDKCVAADVPFFFKQWGGFTPKAGGRRLDRRHWDQFPGANGALALNGASGALPKSRRAAARV